MNKHFFSIIRFNLESNTPLSTKNLFGAVVLFSSLGKPILLNTLPTPIELDIFDFGGRLFLTKTADTQQPLY